MLRKVKLYGDLAKFVGHRVLEADVSSAAQAVRFLIVNWPQLEKYMADRHYKVIAENWELEESELHYPTGQSTIKIIPVVGGAGGNFGKVLLGVALIGASFMFPGAGMFGTTSFLGASAGTGIGTTIGTMVSGIGASLVLSGVAGMLTPVPSIPEENQDPRRSFSFSGVQNTSRAGVCVPLILGGPVLTGSVCISAGIDTIQVEA